MNHMFREGHWIVCDTDSAHGEQCEGSRDGVVRGHVSRLHSNQGAITCPEAGAAEQRFRSRKRTAEQHQELEPLAKHAGDVELVGWVTNCTRIHRGLHCNLESHTKFSVMLAKIEQHKKKEHIRTSGYMRPRVAQREQGLDVICLSIMHREDQQAYGLVGVIQDSIPF